MKRNARNSFLLLILIFSLLLVSCGETVGNNDTSAITETQKAADTYNYTPEAEPYVKTDHSAFKGDNAMIVEWGDVLKIEYTGQAPTRFTSVYKDLTYALVSVKFIKFFPSTSSNEYYKGDGTLNDFFGMWDDNGDHSNIYTRLDEEVKAEISEYYDDVLLIPYESVNLVEKGSKDLVFLRSDTILFPHKCVDANCYWLSDYDEIRAYTVYERRYDDKAVLYPIIDDKVAFDDEFLKKNRDGYYIDPYVGTIIETNELLTELGYEDKLFRDGMTIEDLEAYFDLVTKKITFAPLFGDYLEVPYWKTEDTPFVGLYAMIVEWGDILNIKGSGDSCSIFTSSHGNRTYALVSVKFIKFFSGTTSNQYFTEDSTINNFYGQLPRDEKHSHLYKMLDEDIQSEISKYYDDVFAVPYESIKLIEKGSSHLIFLRSDGIMLPYKCTDDSINHSEDYETTPAYTVELRYDNQPILIPIINGKLSIDDETLERINSDNYFRYPHNNFFVANKYLIELGHDEMIFHNGMTVEELDRYFKVVIKD